MHLHKCSTLSGIRLHLGGFDLPLLLAVRIVKGLSCSCSSGITGINLVCLKCQSFFRCVGRRSVYFLRNVKQKNEVLKTMTIWNEHTIWGTMKQIKNPITYVCFPTRREFEQGWHGRASPTGCYKHRGHGNEEKDSHFCIVSGEMLSVLVKNNGTFFF